MIESGTVVWLGIQPDAVAAHFGGFTRTMFDNDHFSGGKNGFHGYRLAVFASRFLVSRMNRMAEEGCHNKEC
jgi:hypothetical protein